MRTIRITRLVLVLASVATITILVVGAVSIVKLTSDIRSDSANQQAGVLVRSLGASLQNDLLASNLYLATDRAKSIFSEDLALWTCFRIQSINPTIASREDTLVEIGNPKICEARSAHMKQEIIYFDQQQEHPAFRLMLWFSTNDLPIHFRAWQVVMPVTLLFISVAIVVLLTLLTRTLFQMVDDLVRSEGDANTSLAGRELIELVRIKNLQSELKTKHKELLAAHISEERASAMQKLAAQVSHDIRSPLAALNMVVASLKELSEGKRLIIRNASQRINDIANGLLQQSKKIPQNMTAEPITSSVSSAQTMEPVMLVALLDAIVSEKRMQFRERMEIEILGDLNQGYGLFAKVNATEFARVVSNLANNSVEAMPSGGRITVAIRATKASVTVIVSDNGKGIPPDVLARLGERGVTHGKEGTESGSGLGVYHARQTIEQAGGKFTIQSQLGVGTMVTLTLPRVETPKWFVERITLAPNTTVVSVDDDQTIHQIWAGRLTSAATAASGLRHLTFSSIEQIDVWLKSSRPTSVLYLIDFEYIGQGRNGLDLIESAGLGPNAILVTSRYEEPQVRARAESLGVRIIPKVLAPFVPMEIERPRERYDAILLDDDSLVQMTWQIAAKEKGLSILCFTTSEEFWKKSPTIDPTSPIYIDVNLGNNVRGEIIAEKVLARGFSEVFLATGYSADSIKAPAGLRGVVGKDPRFP